MICQCGEADTLYCTGQDASGDLWVCCSACGCECAIPADAAPRFNRGVPLGIEEGREGIVRSRPRPGFLSRMFASPHERLLDEAEQLALAEEPYARHRWTQSGTDQYSATLLRHYEALRRQARPNARSRRAGTGPRNPAAARSRRAGTEPRNNAAPFRRISPQEAFRLAGDTRAFERLKHGYALRVGLDEVVWDGVGYIQRRRNEGAPAAPPAGTAPAPVALPSPAPQLALPAPEGAPRPNHSVAVDALVMQRRDGTVMVRLYPEVGSQLSRELDSVAEADAWIRKKVRQHGWTLRQTSRANGDRDPGRALHLAGQHGHTLCGEHAYPATLVPDHSLATCHYCLSAAHRDSRALREQWAEDTSWHRAHPGYNED